MRSWRVYLLVCILFASFLASGCAELQREGSSSQTEDLVSNWELLDTSLIYSLSGSEYQLLEDDTLDYDDEEWYTVIMEGTESEYSADSLKDLEESKKDTLVDIVGCPTAIDAILYELESSERLLTHRSPASVHPLDHLLIEEIPGSFPEEIPSIIAHGEEPTSDNRSRVWIWWTNTKTEQEIADLCDEEEGTLERVAEPPGGIEIRMMTDEDEEKTFFREREIAGNGMERGYSGLPLVARVFPWAFVVFCFISLFVRSRMKSKIET